MNLSYALHRVVHLCDSAMPGRIKQLVKRIFPRIVPGLYAGIRKLTPDGLQDVTIQSGPLAGRRFLCSLRNERSYWVGNFEPEVQQAFLARLSRGMVVYDIGVHTGFFTLLAAQCVGEAGSVQSFEPHPVNRETVQRNLDLNPDLSGVVRLHPCAVSNLTGNERFNCGAGGSAVASLSRLIPERDLKMEVEVPTITLDDFVRRGGPVPHLIKMDIEGAETFAFVGMCDVLKSHRPIVIVEIHDGEAWRVVMAHADSLNYEIRALPESVASLPASWHGREQLLLLPR